MVSWVTDTAVETMVACWLPSSLFQDAQLPVDPMSVFFVTVLNCFPLGQAPLGLRQCTCGVNAKQHLFFSILAEILWESDKTSKLLLPGKIKNSINKVSYRKNTDGLLSTKCVFL